MNEYFSLKDPAGKLGAVKLKFQSEPLLGGTFGAAERNTLLKSFNESCEINIGFNASTNVAHLEEVFCNIYKSKHAIAINGANTALDLVFKYLNLNENDEIISAAANFHGQHLSILNTKAKLNLADIDENNFCISPSSIKKLLTANTKVVVATDLHGGLADYKKIKEVIDSCSIQFGSKPIIIADAARSIGSPKIVDILEYVDIIIFSLQSKKLISGLGEGGVVATNNDDLAQTLREYRSFGMSMGWGSNFKLSKLQAAVATTQLINIDSVVSLRREKALERAAYIENLNDFCKVVLGNTDSHTFLYFPILLNDSYTRESRDNLITMLSKKFGVGCVVANPPTYLYNPWIKEKISGYRCINSEKFSDRLFCLSFHHHYTQLEESYILDSMKKSLIELSGNTYAK